MTPQPSVDYICVVFFSGVVAEGLVAGVVASTVAFLLITEGLVAVAFLLVAEGLVAGVVANVTQQHF
jgi:hypothetical protein